MDGKKIALLVGALFVAAVTAIMAKSMFGSTAAPQVVAAMPAVPTGPLVLVATKPLPVGTILGPDSVRFQPWPKDLVDGAYYVRGEANVDPAKMIGMVVRSEITAGQPVTQGSLVSPQDRGFLAAALTPGMRAVTVSVSGASAVAGFVFPGDRVDLMLTQTVQGNANGGPALNAAETIVRNIRVLATDQRFDNQPTPDGKTQISPISMVTLEATPKLAEELAVAQKLGTLSLSLRPLADSNQDLEKAIAAGDLHVPNGTDPKSDQKMLLDLASRPQDGKDTFTTGGEVSRFASTSMSAASSPMAGNGAQTAAPAGPVIHIARGTTVTDAPVGGK
ncbi:Flp pilus assembly protein CpaB [Sphingomonas abietis]|uniref:Flp pilus assembly protein CpaB n=1 Tax=Sphingomonas abietis TaxID=3012344 RepID=A0ABY7NPM1_9SPHN|nr:Flp pilus assembly protein CpaB [Sphingomonas abietis]WBO23494.1 Flp pilus assembly protein CpaB [Sphingomonas abietis]